MWDPGIEKSTRGKTDEIAVSSSFVKSIIPMLIFSF